MRSGSSVTGAFSLSCGSTFRCCSRIALAQHQSMEHSFSEAMAVAPFAAVATAFQHRRRLSTVTTALGLLSCSAVLVHLSDGVIEMHFHFFVMVGVITLYQDWWPFLIAIGYVVLQHGVAGAAVSGVGLQPPGRDRPPVAVGRDPRRLHPRDERGRHRLLAAERVAAREPRLIASSSSPRPRRWRGSGSWEWDLGTGDVSVVGRALPAPRRRSGGHDVLHRGRSPRRCTPMTVTRSIADLRRAVEGGSPYASDFRVVLPDGTVRWLHGRGEVTEWADGRPVVMSGTAQDITERKRAETELRETLSLLGATLDSTADGILVVDLEGRITSFNQQFAEMWQLPGGDPRRTRRRPGPRASCSSSSRPRGVRGQGPASSTPSPRPRATT